MWKKLLSYPLFMIGSILIWLAIKLNPIKDNGEPVTVVIDKDWL